MTESDAYLLGTHDEELLRLAFQHRVWAAWAAALWDRAGFRHGDTLLDLGCGPGFATVELAELVGAAGTVHGVDRSQRFLDHAGHLGRAKGLANVVTHRAEVDALPFEDASLDGCYARWVVCFLAAPERALAEVVRALRPGGRIAIMDYVQYEAFTLAPRSPVQERVRQAVIESWRATGGDLDVMRRVPAMLEDLGVTVTDIRPVSRIARPHEPAWHWPRTFFASYLPHLVESGFVDQTDADAFLTEWDTRAATPGAFALLPPMIEVVGEKRSAS